MTGGCFAEKRDPEGRVSHFRVILSVFVGVVAYHLPEFFLRDPSWAVALVAVLIFAPAIRDLFREVPSVELLRALGSWLAPGRSASDVPTRPST